MSTLPQSSHFSTFNYHPNLLDTKEKETGKINSINIKCTQNKASNFILRSPIFSRRQSHFCVALSNHHHPSYDLFAKEQEAHYPTHHYFREVWRGINLNQKSSAPDHIRIELGKQGLIEPVKIKGIRDRRIKFSKTFLLAFTIFELEKKREELLDKTRLRMITEDDFKERTEVEETIVALKKELKSVQKLCLQESKLESRKPLKRLASKA